jgi:hypothetical protein
MRYYDCNVRHKGSVTTVIPRAKVSAAEIAVLKAIHGDDAVVNVVAVGDKRMSQGHFQEYERLVAVYGEKKIKRIFGRGYVGMILPSILDNHEDTVTDESGAAAGKPVVLDTGKLGRAVVPPPPEPPEPINFNDDDPAVITPGDDDDDDDSDDGDEDVAVMEPASHQAGM